MKIKLTRKQRNKIYKQAYKELINNLDYTERSIYLCYLLNEIKGLPKEESTTYLKEFYNFKPLIDEGVWFSVYFEGYFLNPIKNNNLRETVLLFCIEMTK